MGWVEAYQTSSWILGCTSKAQEDFEWNYQWTLSCKQIYFNSNKYFNSVFLFYYIQDCAFLSFMQVLNMQQLYRISTMYWDDKYGTHGVSSEVSYYSHNKYEFHLIKNLNPKGDFIIRSFQIWESWWKWTQTMQSAAHSF